MPRRMVRLVLAVATTLAAWLVVVPARAAAPFCDDRGASMLAPTPELQSPESSIDVGVEDEGCLDGLASPNALDEGRAPAGSELPGFLFVATIPPAVGARFPITFVALVVSTEAAEAPPRGIQDRVDRPPRA